MALIKRKGVWYVRKTINGKQYRVSTKVKDRKVAERRETDIVRRLWSSEFAWKARTAPTFREWAERYERAYTVRKRAPWRDRQILAHALPALGAMRLDQVTRSACQEYLARRAATGVSPWTVNREHGLLRAMWNAAIEDDLIARNPWSKLKPMHAEPRSRVLSVSETDRLLAAVNAEYGRFVTAALGTGLRMREMLGLEPEDIVLDRDELAVRSDTAKWGHSRVVPLCPEVREALVAQIAARRVERGRRLWTQTAWCIRKTLAAAGRRAGVPPFCVHDLRRTFATRAASAGYPMAMLKDVLGHASMETTSAYYVHADRAERGRQLTALDLGLGGVAQKVAQSAVLNKRRVERKRSVSAISLKIGHNGEPSIGRVGA